MLNNGEIIRIDNEFFVILYYYLTDLNILKGCELYKVYNINKKETDLIKRNKKNEYKIIKWERIRITLSKKESKFIKEFSHKLHIFCGGEWYAASNPFLKNIKAKWV